VLEAQATAPSFLAALARQPLSLTRRIAGQIVDGHPQMLHAGERLLSLHQQLIVNVGDRSIPKERRQREEYDAAPLISSVRRSR
jgi:hypothetical protein